MTTANLHIERDLFKELFLPNTEKRILIIKARSGFGKTHCINHCVNRHLPDGIDKITIQLKGIKSISQIFSRFTQKLNLDDTSNFSINLPLILNSPDINIERNWLIGIGQKITINLENLSPEARMDRIVGITDALFGDLEERNANILVTFDSFEKAPGEVRDWISQTFLENVASSNRVRVLLAGEDVPDHNEGYGWSECCNPHNLTGIMEADHWLPVIQYFGRRLPTLEELNDSPQGWFRGVCDAFNGNPQDIVLFIKNRLPRI